jgi:DNA-binding transcriptional ArsR family regulator
METMTAENLADLASLLADRSRASICVALLDGRAWTVGELARHAGVAPSTASEHVTRLAGGGLIETVSQGRHRYVRLAGCRTAEIIENLIVYSAGDNSGTAGLASGPRRTLRAASAAEAMARARTCYDHLAGRLGVRLTDAMTGAGLLEDAAGCTLTTAGRTWLDSSLGIDVAALLAARRPTVRACLDWTERRPHLGGAAGAAICGQFFARGWIARIGTGRAVRLTSAGQQAVPRIFQIDLQDVA